MKNNTKLKTLAFLGTLAALAAPAMAVPVSIETIVTDAGAQVTSIITEALPFVAIVIGGTILFKMVRKFVR